MISTLNTVEDILHGRIILNNLPPIRPRIIRLYLCAPFSDTTDEQNELYENVFPNLREYAMYRYGLEFQVINFHWGIQEALVDNKVLLEYCLNEIKRARDCSIGPTFLTLLGDVYGEPLLPLKIERINFEKIIECLKEKKMESNLLEIFYKLNKNFLVNQYELINDKTIDMNIEKGLVELLKIGCKHAKESGFVLEEQFNTLEYSVIKKLLDDGAFNNEDKFNKVFIYSRVTSKSKDVKLENIKEVTVNKLIPSEQIYKIRIENSDPANNKKYLKNFSEHYLKLFKSLIDKFVQQNPEFSYKNSYEDALYHYHFISANVNHDFLAGGEGVLKVIRDYIHDASFRQPLILTGPMGSGKTSCLATFASTLHLQLIASQKRKNSKDAIIVRFIGADKKSMDIRNLLKSICLQMNAIFNKNKTIPDKFNDLKIFFKNFLIKSQNEDFEDVDEDYEPRLILILDSVQDLYENDFAHKLDWLPTYLKANCKIILSVSNENTELIERLKNKYTNSRSYVNLDNIEPQKSDILIKKYLNYNKYRLEDEQMELIKKFIADSRLLSLHLKLFSSEFLKWKSYTPLSEIIIETSLKSAITRLFIQLENKHGAILVKYLLSYLTVSQGGLSEMELQDILSLDDTLLAELRSNLKQPNNVLVVPFFYMLPLVQDLQKHLIVRPDNGLYVIYWRHKLFAQVVNENYIVDKSFEIQLHSNISEYYLGTWAENRLKPLEYEDFIQDEKLKAISAPNKKINYKINTNRLAPKQPLEYESFHTHIKARFNLRKLSMLPYHLLKAGMIEKLLNDVYFNIEWHYYKICAFDLQSLLHDFELYKENNEVNLIRDSLKMSEPAILENKNHLFIELTGRLIAYYDISQSIRNLINQCDRMSLKYNPIVPFRQIHKAPSWILQEEFNIGIEMNDDLQVDYIENNFYGKILVAKNLGSPMTKFFDLELLQAKNDILMGKGIVYASKNGRFACYIEDSSKLVIKRIENGEFYNEVVFGDYEIGQVYLSSKYAAISIHKAPSPIIIELESAKIIKTLPYQSSFTCISPDDQVILIHSEDKLNYHKLPDLARLISLQSREIPEIVVFANKNTRIYTLTRGTKQVTFYSLLIEKRHFQTLPILQDTDIFDMKLTSDESKLLICSLQCLYAINAKSDACELLYKLKPNLPSLSDLSNFKYDDKSGSAYSVISTPTPTPSSASSLELTSKRVVNRNVYNGFGSALNNQIVYATYYTYLFCWDSITGALLRVFQSTPSANRIIKSYSSNLTNSIVSLLDNGNFIFWNLSNVNKKMNFEDMMLYSNPVANCCLPKLNFLSTNSSLLAVSYSTASPDAKLHSLKDKFSTKTVLSAYYNEQIDNPLTAQIESIFLDEAAQFCLIILNLEEFQGKRIPEDNDFIKKVATLITLNEDALIIEKYSYIIRKKSRFELKAQFVTKSSVEVYLVLQTTSCLSDFDPFYSGYDWSDFETAIKIYGPIKARTPDKLPEKLMLFDEFKLFGELLDTKLSITNKTFIYAALTYECHKTFDKDDPLEVVGKRYDTHLNIYEIFENKKEKMPVQLFDLNEFLTIEDMFYKNILLDIQVMSDGNLLLIYSKNGGGPNGMEKFEYDYDNYKFKRNFQTPKAGLVYDPKENKILKSFRNFLNISTDVTKIRIADNNCILDNLWYIYSLETGNILYRVDKDNIYGLDYKWTRFILNGRYLLATNKLNNKLYVLRCYDSKIVASLWLHDKVTSVSVGELDRTIVVGTNHGYLQCLKLLIDLENVEANEKYLKFFRFHTLENTSLESIKNTESTGSFTYLSLTNFSSTNENQVSEHLNKKHLNKESIDDKFGNTSKFASLNYDIQRMLNSAYEHKRLKSRESSSRARSASILSMQMKMSAPETQNVFEDQHSGILKTNLTNLTLGLKYANTNTTSKACCIQ